MNKHYLLSVLAVLLPGPVLAADAINGAVERQPVNIEAIVMFLIFVAMTLGITWWASRRTRSRSDYYTAGGKYHRFSERLGYGR